MDEEESYGCVDIFYFILFLFCFPLDYLTYEHRVFFCIIS